MSQNKKIWFYAEGYAEVEFIKWLFMRHFPDVIFANSKDSFFREKKENICFVHNCRDVDKIPYDIVDLGYWAQNDAVSAIVCDVDRLLKCPIKRKEKILEKIIHILRENNEVFDLNSRELYFVCSNPAIEDIYFSEKNIIPDALSAIYNATYKRQLDRVEGHCLNDSSLKLPDRLKIFFKQHHLNFSKREFAGQFFPRLNYSECNHSTVKRLYNFVNSILNH